MAQQKTILVIDDDDDLRGALAEQIAAEEEFRAVEAQTGTEGIELAQTSQPDLILLDVDLPDLNGCEVAAKLRDAGVHQPIIMLTAAAEDQDAIAGLDSGADDYVTKPFRFAVLLARIRAQLRSHEQSENAILHIGPYVFRPAQRLLVDAKQKRIRLTDKETSILRYLYRLGGRPAPRDELLAEVWGYNVGVTTHTLETHVYRLRQKIESDPAGARLLLTDAGGYRLAL